MKIFAFFFMIIMIFSIIKGFKELQKDRKKLAKELGISVDHPMNKSLQDFVYLNHFRFFMLLFVIFYTGLMICFVIIF